MNSDIKFKPILAIILNFVILLLVLVASVFSFSIKDASLLLNLFVFVFFGYALYIVLNTQIYFSRDSIVETNKFGLRNTKKEIKFSDIKELSYKFFFLIELSYFEVIDKYGSSIPIHFGYPQKKIIKKIQKIRPDLKTNDWVERKVFNYWKTLVPSVLILLFVLLLVFKLLLKSIDS